jgi:hypothetical protein
MARDLASWVSVRPPPPLVLRHTTTQIDASAAFAAVGEIDSARACAKRALKALQGTNADALSLDVLLVLDAAQPDERVRTAAAQVADAIAAQLSPSLAAGFRRRVSRATTPR